MATDLTKLAEELDILRQREVQMLGAALSKRNWHETETAYNQLRDRIDGPIAQALRRAAQMESSLREIEADGLRNHNIRCKAWWPDVRAALEDKA